MPENGPFRETREPIYSQPLFGAARETEQGRRAQGAGRTGIAPAEAVGTGVSRKIIVHPAAGLVYEAVIRHGQEREVRGRSGGADLLKEINRNNKEEMKKSIDLILREIERSDNEKMRYKREIMKAFVTERFFDLDPDADIIEAYNQYEKEVLQTDIESFSVETKLNVNFISTTLHKYFIDPKAVTKEYLRNELSKQGIKGLLILTEHISKLQEFMDSCYNKFTTEG